MSIGLLDAESNRSIGNQLVNPDPRPAKVSLSDLIRKGKTNEVYKWDLFQAITGVDFWGPDYPSGKGIGYVPEFSLEREEIPLVYRAVKKMQERYKADDAYGKYYQPCFEEIEKVYKRRNLKKFNETVRYLLISIACD